MHDTTVKRLDNASEFFIMTPMVKALHDTLKQWTWCGLTGGVIVGEARGGKSKSIISLNDAIPSREGGSIPVFKISIGERDKKTVREVHARIARKLGFAVRARDSADDLAFNIKTCLMEVALTNEARQVILIIDEAQFLTFDQLPAFAEIYNDLFDAHFNCIIFFIANADLFVPLAEQILREENTYIRERFFNHIHTFYGVRNVNELKACLRQYDKYIVVPEDKVTATEYYCPHLYRSGWRLAHIALPLWQHYREEYMKPLHHTSWRMSQMIRSVNILLMDYLPQYERHLDEDTLKAIIVRSLEAAAIRPNLRNLVRRAC